MELEFIVENFSTKKDQSRQDCVVKKDKYLAKYVVVRKVGI